MLGTDTDLYDFTYSLAYSGSIPLKRHKYTNTTAGALPIPAVQWTYTFNRFLLIISFKSDAPS